MEEAIKRGEETSGLDSPISEDSAVPPFEAEGPLLSYLFLPIQKQNLHPESHILSQEVPGAKTAASVQIFSRFADLAGSPQLVRRESPFNKKGDFSE